MLKIKIKRKQKWDILLFKGENNLKIFQNCQVFYLNSPSLREEMECKRKECRAKEYTSNPL